MASHLASLWKGDFLELGNGLLKKWFPVIRFFKFLVPYMYFQKNFQLSVWFLFFIN